MTVPARCLAVLASALAVLAVLASGLAVLAVLAVLAALYLHNFIIKSLTVDLALLQLPQ